MPLKLTQNYRMAVNVTSTRVDDRASAARLAAWDEFVMAQPRAHLLQLSSWGELKARFGWAAQVVTLTVEHKIRAGAMVLKKRLPFRAGTMAYLPMGGYTLADADYAPLWRAIRRETGAAFLKLEPGHFPAGETPDLPSMGFQRSPQTIQPATTIVIDINRDDETILRRMNQGTRRKLRKSLAGGISFTECDLRGLPAFYQLTQQTGSRNAFGVHSAAYFEAVIDLLIPRYGTLLLAEHQGECLAAIMVFALGDTAWYLYGASSRAQSNLYASYGIQWQALQWAKRRGCRYYDLWGVPDHDEATLEAEFKQRGDGLWGVYGFKRGWGGEVRHASGAWDLAWNPAVYAAYRAGLNLRRQLGEGRRKSSRFMR